MFVCFFFFIERGGSRGRTGTNDTDVLSSGMEEVDVDYAKPTDVTFPKGPNAPPPLFPSRGESENPACLLIFVTLFGMFPRRTVERGRPPLLGMPSPFYLI